MEESMAYPPRNPIRGRVNACLGRRVSTRCLCCDFPVAWGANTSDKERCNHDRGSTNRPYWIHSSYERHVASIIDLPDFLSYNLHNSGSAGHFDIQ